jgi:hypothetical protein
VASGIRDGRHSKIKFEILLEARWQLRSAMSREFNVPTLDVEHTIA